MKKIVAEYELGSLGEILRSGGSTVVWTNGCFDLLHAGHVRSLQAARALGDVLVVGINSDDSVRRLKGPLRPVVPEKERAELVGALACVSHVVVFGGDSPEWCITLLRPHVHCKGSDYAPPHGKPIPEAALVESYGGRVAFLPLAAGLSSTELIRRTSPKWSAAVSSLRGKRLLVVGDVMLDEYLAGDVRRVCPEAPVPVVEVNSRWHVPGGAANAAANAAALGGKVTLGGVTGDDAAAGQLAQALRIAGVEPTGLIANPSRPTTVKLRVLARGQQVVRADTESTAPIEGKPAELLAAWAERVVAEVDAVLLSDYGKGVLANGIVPRVIEAARRAGRPVVVDPKGTDFWRYRGATVLKPNLGELGDLTGRRVRDLAGIVAAGSWLAEQLPGTAVLVTRGPDGMTMFRPDIGHLSIAADPTRQVFDVTGAGDTAAATLALALGAGLSVETAARLANAAAGVAVSKAGTAVVTPDELLAVLP